jgi:hypothetical protein
VARCYGECINEEENKNYLIVSVIVFQIVMVNLTGIASVVLIKAA